MAVGIAVGIAAIAITPSIYTGKLAWKYLEPEVAAKKAREAFYQWSGKDVEDALASMQEAQTQDQAAIDALNGFFSDLTTPDSESSALDAIAHEYAHGASTAKGDALDEEGLKTTEEIAAVDGADGEKSATEGTEVMTIARVQEIIVNQISRRIEDRAALIKELQNTIDIKNQRELAAQQRNISDFYKHPRARF